MLRESSGISDASPKRRRRQEDAWVRSMVDNASGPCRAMSAEGRGFASGARRHRRFNGGQIDAGGVWYRGDASAYVHKVAFSDGRR
ncbi:hypothetical protein Arub01_39430 [Actinomadura rubrobrunea]|uniref:Uncharacterized protein n=1 Tax=Actinomadura rubrobrunea TaxID=115335 RepID=A0A9W6PWE6_9ACTN|nr:hypothetical protein Arub01_39430 [Actinomadura rubrobrunea]